MKKPTAARAKRAANDARRAVAKAQLCGLLFEVSEFLARITPLDCTHACKQEGQEEAAALHKRVKRMGESLL